MSISPSITSTIGGIYLYADSHSELTRKSVVFITGVAGVGKTTLAQGLELGPPKMERVSIGTLILNEARRTYPELSHAELRGDPDRFAPRVVVDKAVETLAMLVHDLSLSTHVVIESHAVTVTSLGIRVTPFSLQVLRQLSLELILLVEASEDNILVRVRKRDGEPPIGPEHDTHLTDAISMQRSIATAYAVAGGCPLYLIRNDYSLEHTLYIARTILSSYLMTR